MTVAPFLSAIPVLAGIPPEQLERLAAGVRLRRIPAGEWLLREGDDAESAFIVQSGRLEVLAEGPPKRLIAVLSRGDVFGELGLLVDGRRTASVRARRDSNLLELSRRDFETLIQEAPSFALGLTRTMGAYLAGSRPTAFTRSRPRTIVVAGLDDPALALETANALSAALQRHGSVGRLHPDDGAGPEGRRTALDRAESMEDRVVLACSGGPADEWTGFCLSEADLVLVVSHGTPGRSWMACPAALQGCELLVAARSIEDAMIRAFEPEEMHALATAGERDHAIDVLARRIAGRAVGVVLSGGGARAFAHLGVLEVLEEAGLTIDRLGGVSLGALVAAAWASGWGSDEIYGRFERNFLGANPSNDFTWPAYSLIRGSKTRRLLRAEFGDARIEGLPTRYFSSSSDLLAREAVAHRRGPVWKAVYASMALPGVFPPVRTDDGRLLVDGGVLDNLPVAEMARAGEGPVLAVDVTGRMRQAGRPVRPRMTKIGRPVRRFLTGSDTQVPRLGETVMRTVTVGSLDAVAAARERADFVISPEVDRIGLMEFQRLAEVRDAGRRAAREALADMPVELLG
jgi:NTE family protein